MSNKHIHICDICGAQSDSIRIVHEYSFREYFEPPKKWSVFDGKDICSKKCAKEAADKTKELAEVSCCSCCAKESK